MSKRIAYTVDEVAAMLGVNRKTIYANLNKLPHVRIGRVVRIPAEAFQRWLTGQEDTHDLIAWSSAER